MNIVIFSLALTIVIPIGLFYLSGGKAANFKKLLFLNVGTFFSVLLVATLLIFTGDVLAQEVESHISNAAASVDSGLGSGLKYMAAAVAVGCSTIGAGLATGKAASAALGALSENENIMGKALIFVALAEGVAIYGLLIAFIIINS